MLESRRERKHFAQYIWAILKEVLRSRAVDRRPIVDKYGDTLWPESDWPDAPLKGSKK